MNREEIENIRKALYALLKRKSCVGQKRLGVVFDQAARVGELEKILIEWGLEAESAYDAWDGGYDNYATHEIVLRSCLRSIIREAKALKQKEQG